MKYIKKRKCYYTKSKILDIETLNKMIVEEMLARGFTPYDEFCKKMNHHIYFDNNPLSVLYDEVITVDLQLKIYNFNTDTFDDYIYSAIVNKKGFDCQHNLPNKYTLLVKIISDIIYNSSILNLIRIELMS